MSRRRLARISTPCCVRSHDYHFRCSFLKILHFLKNSSGTARLGEDFVLTNLHDLRIWGDDKSSTVNIDGMVLFSPDSEVRRVAVKLNGVDAGADAGKISVAPDKAMAGFNIVVNK